MITNRWIQTRKPYWDNLSSLLGRIENDGIRSLSHDELRETAFLYRQVAADLATVRGDRSAATIEARLNHLLSALHSVVYAGRKADARAAIQFFLYDYPALFRRMLPFTLVSLLLLVGGGLLGTVLSLAHPGFVDWFLGPKMMATIHQHRMWTHSVTSIAPQASSGILTNNLSVTFATFATGIMAGLGTIYLMIFNGLLIGIIATACHWNGMSIPLWSFVAPHGSLELPAIVIAGGAGLRLAYGLLFPGMHSRRYSFSKGGAEAVRLLSGVIPLLVVAGILEGFFSPSDAPVWLKFMTGAVLFTMLVAWLSSTIRRRNQNAIDGSPSWNEITEVPSV